MCRSTDANGIGKPPLRDGGRFLNRPYRTIDPVGHAFHACRHAYNARPTMINNDEQNL